MQGFRSDSSQRRCHAPIELQTENGFSIIRGCDLDPPTPSEGIEHCFRVRDPHGYQLEITVDISDRAVTEIVRRSQGRLSLNSSYWINCAERHLAAYLWENDDYPPDARLTVNYLTPDDIDLARRWKDQQTGDPPNLTCSTHARTNEPNRAEQFRDARPARAVEPQPIKFVTENGYSIVRLSEIDNSKADSARECRFRVQNPNGWEREISVRFDDQLISEIQHRRRSSPLSLTSKYWLLCAERCLAAYLWENDRYPPEEKLTMSVLSDDELLLATHWKE